MRLTTKGFAAASGAFAIWGVFPLYFHALRPVSPFQVIAHRIIWSCVFMMIWTAVRGDGPLLRATLADRRIVARLAMSAALITVNWVVYVWAVINGHVIESSLGYFINPLVNVLLGVALLSETLNAAQWTAIALAAAGVGYLTVLAGHLPWISLALAFSFGFYGLIRKVIKVEALPGLATETLLLVPFAAAYLIGCESMGYGSFAHAGLGISALLIGTGPLTAVALFLFAFGARLLPYSTVGILQFIAPTLQLACGVFVLHEKFEQARLAGFALIWLALLIYAGEGLWRSRKSQCA